LGYFLLVGREEGATTSMEGAQVARCVSLFCENLYHGKWNGADDIRLKQHAKNEGKVVRMMPGLSDQPPARE
jgi:hypothetical protein